MTLEDKLLVWDEGVRQAYADLVLFAMEHPGEVKAVARGRHVWGHYRYGDRNYMEYDQDRLMAEIVEELADAVNYMVRRNQLLK